MSRAESPNIVIHDLGGNCPVQADGEIDGEPFYFHARGSRWSLEIGHGDSVWEHTEQYSDVQYAAGWMTLEEARAFIAKGAELWRAQFAVAPMAETTAGRALDAEIEADAKRFRAIMAHLDERGSAQFTVWASEMVEMDNFVDDSEDEIPMMFDTLRDLADALIEQQSITPAPPTEENSR